MSIKIKISYEKPQELYTVLNLLHPIIQSYKTEKGGNGQYKRAYLKVNIPTQMHRKLKTSR